MVQLVGNPNINFNFFVWIGDEEFDNANNEYGEMKLHRYTNMKNDSDFNTNATS